jgi:hypothetical protein
VPTENSVRVASIAPSLPSLPGPVARLAAPGNHRSRHQLAVVHRSRRPRLRLTAADRRLWVWLSRARGGAVGRSHCHAGCDRVGHRRSFRLFWTWKGRHCTGRPALPPDVRALIRDMSIANPLWGAPRIHGELLKLGIAVSQSTVAKYMRRHARPPSQTWRTLPTHHASQIMAADLFRRADSHVPAALRTHHPRARPSTNRARRSPNILRRPGPHSSCAMPFSENEAPRYLLHDCDSVFADVATTIAGMNTQAVRTAPRSPWQNAYSERVIGSIRRECLDRVIAINETGPRGASTGTLPTTWSRERTWRSRRTRRSHD